MHGKNLIVATALLLGAAAAWAEQRVDQPEAANAPSQAQQDQMRDAMGVQAPASQPRAVVAPDIRIVPVGEPDSGAQDSTFRDYRGLWAAILGGAVGLVLLALIFLILTEGGAPPADIP